MRFLEASKNGSFFSGLFYGANLEQCLGHPVPPNGISVRKVGGRLRNLFKVGKPFVQCVQGRQSVCARLVA